MLILWISVTDTSPLKRLIDGQPIEESNTEVFDRVDCTHLVSYSETVNVSIAKGKLFAGRNDRRWNRRRGATDEPLEKTSAAE